MIEHVLDDTCVAPARSALALVTEYIVHVAPNYPQISSGFVNPRWSTACVEVSAPESTQNILASPSVMKQVEIWDIPVPKIVDDTVEVVIGHVQVIAAVGSAGVSTTLLHGQVHPQLFVVEEAIQNSVEIPIAHEPMTDETFESPRGSKR